MKSSEIYISTPIASTERTCQYFHDRNNDELVFSRSERPDVLSGLPQSRRQLDLGGPSYSSGRSRGTEEAPPLIILTVGPSSQTSIKQLTARMHSKSAIRPTFRHRPSTSRPSLWSRSSNRHFQQDGISNRWTTRNRHGCPCRPFPLLFTKIY